MRFRRHTTCLFEVLMAVLMSDLGVRFFLNPDILQSSNMGILAVTIGVGLFSTICVSVGLARIAILFMEDKFKPYGVHLRIAVTAASALIWAIMVAGFLEKYLTSGNTLPPGFDMLLTQAIGELIVVLQLARETT